MEYNFNYEGLDVRTVVRDGNPWFVAKDVSEILGFRMASDMTRNLDDDEKDTHIIRTLGGEQKLSIINEAGLYASILKSRKPEARNFKRWVTHEVLPSIRKTGGYVANEELFIDTYLPFADEHTKRLFGATLETVRKQNEMISVMKPKVEQHDRFISAENVESIDVVAKSLFVGSRKLIALLKVAGVFHKKGRPRPKQQYINDGCFVVKQIPSLKGDYNYPQTFITAKGIERIDRFLETFGGAKCINNMKVSEIEKLSCKN